MEINIWKSYKWKQ